MPAPLLTSGPALPFRLEDWLVRPATNELTRGEETFRIEPKMMDVLCALAAQPGEVLSRDALLEQVWPGVVVTEDTLNGTVSKLRKALGDDPRAPRFIETIPRVGYRLRVRPVPDAPVPSLYMASRAPTGGWRRLWPGLALLLIGLAGFGLWQAWPRPAAPSVLRPLTTAPGVERQPAFSPAGDRIAYAAHARGGTSSDVFVADATGEAVRRLTEGPADDLFPAWSPDGVRVAFLRCTPSACNVYAAPALGGRARRLSSTAAGPYGLTWSPDGRSLAVAGRPAPGAPYRVLLLDAATGTERPLTHPPADAAGDFEPAFSPDGQRLAFVRHRQGAEHLFRIDLDDDRLSQLTRDGRRIEGFAWAPDGNSLLLRRQGTPGFMRLPADGGALQPVASPPLRNPGRFALSASALVVEDWTLEVNFYTLHHEAAGWSAPQLTLASTAADRQPALSPDGEQVAFVSDRSGVAELWTARRDGTNPIRLTDFGGSGLGAPRWSPDGRRIVFEVQQEGTGDLYVVDVEGGPPRRLTDGKGYSIGPRWSPDGRWVYFGSDRDGRQRVWRLAPDSAGAAPTPATPPGAFVGQPSLNDEVLYFTKRDTSGLWSQPRDGGPPRRLVDDLDRVDWGSWTVTRAGLFYLARHPDGRAGLHLLDPETGRTTVLDTLEALPAREPALAASADGRTLLFARIDRRESDLLITTPPF